MNKKIVIAITVSVFTLTVLFISLTKQNKKLEPLLTEKPAFTGNSLSNSLETSPKLELEEECLECEELKQKVRNQIVKNTEQSLNSKNPEEIKEKELRFGEIGSHSSYELSEFHNNDLRGLTDWSIKTQQSIYETLNHTDFLTPFNEIGVHVEQIECKTSTCKIEISSSNSESISDFKKQFEIQKNLIKTLKRNDIIITTDIQVVSRNNGENNMSMYYYWPEQDKVD